MLLAGFENTSFNFAVGVRPPLSAIVSSHVACSGMLSDRTAYLSVPISAFQRIQYLALMFESAYTLKFDGFIEWISYSVMMVLSNEVNAGCIQGTQGKL